MSETTTKQEGEKLSTDEQLEVLGGNHYRLKAELDGMAVLVQQLRSDVDTRTREAQDVTQIIAQNNSHLVERLDSLVTDLVKIRQGVSMDLVTIKSEIDRANGRVDKVLQNIGRLDAEIERLQEGVAAANTLVEDKINEIMGDEGSGD